MSTGDHLALRVCFKGTNFQGSQLQKRTRSVQGELEKALRILWKSKFRINSISRTDSGVHSYDSVFFLKNEANRLKGVSDKAAFKFFGSLNAILPNDIRIQEIGVLRSDFLSYRDVLWKEYRYFVLCSRQSNPFWADRAWHIVQPLDFKLISSQIKKLRGEHDFASFAKSSGAAVKDRRRGSIRKILLADLHQTQVPELKNAKILEFRIRADGFLHHMVRNIVGTLVDKSRDPDFKLETLLKQKSRSLAGRTAPPTGLFLYKTQFRRGIYAPLQPPKID